MTTQASDDTVYTFPTDGEPSTWTLPATLLEEWSALFPELDLSIEARDAYTWVLAAPRRRKTAGGMPRFLLSWFRRSARDLRTEIAPRRRAAQAPPAGTWDQECRRMEHNPMCAWPAHHAVRLEIAKAGCVHPGVCQTFAECQQKGSV